MTSCLVLFDRDHLTTTESMYHLLKGLHGYLTRCLLYRVLYYGEANRNYRKEEFSVIIVGLDGAGKTVR